ncbi:MAG: hypothetical protein A2175_01305 [Candidatus Nealsonbacteria bacterium RBG_13_42_11]|uniref:Fibronectin type-III domain-containing protein n=1 Tax=Candidatus Nealsonbacteria bacterium RBG_13_42_11 TaxID=1801663 RepID=A0A1G2DZW2_9BACT|nr:MAG: hypothetical protein A2175_01305 [Candidatus Nealsonbacteria bacterium RBG_13_42_11]
MISLINNFKIMKNLLIIGVFSIFIFGAGFCLAINTPSGLTPCEGNDVELSPLLNWEDVSGADHYELYYKRESDKDWTDRYPSISSYQASGLSPSTVYQWYVVSCGDPACLDKAESSLCSFKTKELEPPPNGNGHGNGGGPIEILNPLKCQDLECVINALLNLLFFLAMGLAPILIVYAGFLLLTAAGDAAKINKARQVILWTVIALIVVILAKGLPSIVKGMLGG